MGSEQGKKVLLVHGISTPYLSLGGVAEWLGGRGCLVMLVGEDIECFFGWVLLDFYIDLVKRFLLSRDQRLEQFRNPCSL